jgi:hypothetical protein
MDKMIFDRYNCIAIFAMICIMAFALMAVSNWILLSDDVYYNTFGEQLPFEKIDELIDVNKKWNWLIYVILPVVYSVKFFLVAGCLFIGILLGSFDVSFKTVYKVVMVAEFIFLIPPIIKVYWFGFFNTNYSLIDLQYFFPLSMLSLFEISEISSWLLYPLQTLSVFEIAYWLVLAYGLHLITKEKYGGMLGLVASSYGVGLLVWVVFIVFISVSIAP